MFHAPVTINSAVRVTWPHQIGVVPALADCRQHRPADDALDAAMDGSATVVVCQVLSGLGGIGKTQLAAGLVHRMWTERRVDLLVWVTATSRINIVTAYARAAVVVTGVNDSDPEMAATRFVAWMAEPNGRRWLIVVDDLSDPADMAGLWPPTTVSGRTVVTTRRRDAALLAGRRPVDVGLFSPHEAEQYLRDKLGNQSQRLIEADGLASDLGYLPLALAQAATYIVDQGLTCESYRRRLASRRLGEVAPDVLPDDNRATVAATWSLSIDLADQRVPQGYCVVD